MDVRTTVTRTAGDFVVFLAIIVGGAVATSTAADMVAPPASQVVTGAGIAAIAVAGLAWLRFVGPANERRRSSAMAGLGGAVGVLAGQSLVGESAWVAVGAGLGAGAFALAGVLWSRRRA